MSSTIYLPPQSLGESQAQIAQLLVLNMCGMRKSGGKERRVEEDEEEEEEQPSTAEVPVIESLVIIKLGKL